MLPDPNLRDRLDAYVTDLFALEDDVLRWIQQQADERGLPVMSVKPFEGRLLQFLIQAVGARKVVEIGALAGYSGVWMARALPADGELYTVEREPAHAALTRESFARAGFSGRAHVLEGDALVMLAKLSSHAPFDFVFIDADKLSSPRYFDWAERNLRPGGMVAIHNAYRRGAVLDPKTEDDHAVDDMNRILAARPGFSPHLIGVGDGLLVAIRLP
ncbi:MAG TPA: O-methyltransferase [Candidatus Limnocylindrales bacterium]|nr:O-methyltransferase [Candidatus Limnocylindrales bacterium]